CLRIKNIVLQQREIARDRGFVALAPAGMIEHRVVDAAHTQEQADGADDDDRQRPQRAPRLIRRQFTCLNVQYLLRKKLTTMPATVAMNHVLCPCPKAGATRAETISPTSSAIAETVKNCVP